MLTQQLEDIQKELAIDVAVLTEASINGASPANYADKYYGSHGYSSNGVLLLLVMDERDWLIIADGSCIVPVNIDEIGDSIVPYFSDGEYYEGFSLYGKLVQAQMEYQHERGDMVVDSYGNVTFAPDIPHWYDGLIPCLIIGIVIGGISVAVMAYKMKSVRSRGSAADYVESGSLQLSIQQDRYLYQTVTRRPKPKDNGGAHRSSSGRSHGGGKF